MSKIKVDIDNAETPCKGVVAKANSVSIDLQNVRTVRQNLDRRILARKGLEGRLIEAEKDIRDIEKKMWDLGSFISQSLRKYEKAEDKVYKDLLNRFPDIKLEQAIKDTGKALGNAVLMGSLDFLSKLKAKDLFMATKGPFGQQKTLKQILNNKHLRFKVFKKDGKVLIKLTNRKGLLPVANKLFNDTTFALGYGVGHIHNWTSTDLVHKLSNQGLELYDMKSKKLIGENLERFKDASFFDDLKASAVNVGSSGVDKFKNAMKGLPKDFASELNVFNDFTGYKGADGLTKVGKSLGALGTVLTIADNAGDAYENGDMNWKKFGVDLGVDLAASSGAMAAGAAVGSVFAPPVGTVVGAGVGAVANVVINTEFSFLGGKSVVGAAKEAANKVVDSIADGVKKLGKIFW